jgi:autotransporter-associated beta strand protein
MNDASLGKFRKSNFFPRRASGPLLGSIAALLIGSAAPVVAQSGTWLTVPFNNNWNSGFNWSGNNVPTVTASFGTSSITSISLISSSATVNNIVFNSGASAYTISSAQGGSYTLTINGAGITNNSGVMQNFVSPTDGSGNHGIIQFSNSATAGSNITITNNGATISSGSGAQTFFTGNSSAGNATIINNGNSVATSASYGGYTTFIDNSTAGNATLIANGGTNGGAGGGIFFIQQTTGGTASVILNGNGFLDISSAPATSISIGSLAGNGNVYLGINNLAVGSNNTSTTFSGVIQDGGGAPGAGGSLTKIGSGSLDLTGANTYTGNTIVSAGTLYVDGSIVSPTTTVNSGALLGGSGMIGGSLINNGGVITGRGTGTLTVKGNYTQSSSGTLTLGIGGLSSSQHGLLAVGGAASLGGTLNLQASNGFKLAAGQEVTFLTAKTVAGEFSSVQNLSSFNGTGVTAEILYLPGAVELAAEKSTNIYNQINGQSGVTTNDLQTALLLDGILNNPRAAKLFDVLNQANLSQLIKDIELIDPGQLAVLSNIGSALSNATLLSLEQRFLAIQSSGAGGPAGPDGKGGKEVMAPAAGDRWGSFITGSGDFERVDDTPASRGFNMDAGGVTLGVDYRFTDHLVAGIFGSYTNTGIDISNGGRINVNTGKGGLYGTYFDGGFYVNSALEGGYSSYDNHRESLGGTARSSTDGGDFSALFAPGYNWTMGGLTFGPTTRFQYSYQGTDGFTESGSLAPMSLSSQHTESIISGVGVKASYDWKLGSTIIRPELRLEWEHEYGDTATGIDAQLAGVSGNALRFTTPDIGRDDLHLGAGCAVVFNDRFTAYFYYDGQFFRENYDSSTITGGLRVSF